MKFLLFGWKIDVWLANIFHLLAFDLYGREVDRRPTNIKRGSKFRQMTYISWKLDVFVTVALSFGRKEDMRPKVFNKAFLKDDVFELGQNFPGK